MSLDPKYRLFCTMDYDIFIEIFFPLYKHDKIQIFLSKHPNNLFGNNRATFDMLLLHL